MNGITSSSSSPLASICARCTRKLARQQWQSTSSSLIHVRGKSKKVKPRTTLPVRLLKDLPEYGRAGSIVPVPIGQMRNFYFPTRIADYVPLQEMKQLRREETPIERDFGFGKQEKQSPGEKSQDSDEASISRVEFQRLSPSEAFNLLSDVIPPLLDFYRKPITNTIDRDAPQPQRTAETEAQTVSPPPEMSPRQTPENIYGSVSADDVNMAIKAVLYQRGEDRSVLSSDADIKFVKIAGSDVETDRIKKLGEYEYEVRIKGHDEVITRYVRVLPEDEQAANFETPTGGVGVSIDASAPSTAEKAASSA